ncbi:MAG TPA: DMT family transporter [Solirubrobacteraceae bacterium]|nr:DMT family transporter [Solirubrobacteraceae bacterium]
MLAILGGIGAAAAWAVSILCSSRSSRMIEPMAVVAWVMLVGLIITAPLAAATGIPANLHGAPLAWLILAGAGNVAGLIVNYAALRIGQVSLVAPIVSTEGAIAAIISVFAGQSLGASVALALLIIAVGVGLAALPSPDTAVHAAARHPTAVLLAGLAAASFGASLYATGRAGAALPASWVVLSARLVGAVALALPLALSGRLRLTAAAVPLVIASGLAEIAGFYCYTFGSRHGLAIAAVLSSQFAVIALAVSYALFGERLTRVQLVGVGCVIVGVAALSALRA